MPEGLIEPRRDHYRQIRARTMLVNDVVLRTIPRFVVLNAARALGLARGEKLVLESEFDQHCLMERSLHDELWLGKNAIAHFRASEALKALDPEQRAALDALAGARFSVFLLESTDPQRGCLYLRDVRTDDVLEVMDLNLSMTATPGVLFATRVFEVEGIRLTTGVTYSFDPEHQDLLLEGLRRRRGAGRRTRPPSQGDWTAYVYRRYRRLGRGVCMTAPVVPAPAHLR